SIQAESTTVEPIQLVNGLVGQYFNDMNLAKFAATRVDSTVNFNWERNAPMTGVNPDNFSVRWQGKVKGSHTSGTKNHKFFVKSDDGVRLWIDNKLLVDQWIEHGATEYSATVPLTAGKYHDIKIEYFDKAYGASMVLSWQPEGGTKVVMPTSALFALDLSANKSYDGDKDGMPDVWELQYGLDTGLNDGSKVLNPSGVTSLRAYQSGVNPWTGSKTGSSTAPVSSAVTLAWNTPTTRMDGSALYPYQ